MGWNPGTSVVGPSVTNAVQYLVRLSCSTFLRGWQLSRKFLLNCQPCGCRQVLTATPPGFVPAAMGCG